jgi:hypothetical protein
LARFPGTVCQAAIGMSLWDMACSLFRNRLWLAFTRSCGSLTCARTWRRTPVRPHWRVRSPSGPSVLLGLNLLRHRKTGRLGDATLPAANHGENPNLLLTKVFHAQFLVGKPAPAADRGPRNSGPGRRKGSRANRAYTSDRKHVSDMPKALS